MQRTRFNSATSPTQGVRRRKVEREIKFFPQFRVSPGVPWHHIFQINKDNGFATIEECNEHIDSMEREEERSIGKISEWRIKEQLV